MTAGAARPWTFADLSDERKAKLEEVAADLRWYDPTITAERLADVLAAGESIREEADRRGVTLYQVRADRWRAGRGADPSACGRPSPAGEP